MSANILEIYCDSTGGILKTNDLIPKQNLKLVAYRVSFASSANQKLAKMIKFNASFLGSNNFSKLSDEILVGTYQASSAKGIPLPCSATAGEVIPCNIDVPMDKDIDGDIAYSITSIGGFTGFENLTLIFNYYNGMI